MKLIIEQGASVTEREIVGDVRIVLQAPALPPAPPAPEPAPEPPSAPEPSPAPEPVPPSEVVAQHQSINLRRCVCLTAWHNTDRYERFRRNLSLPQTGPVSLHFHAIDFGAGGAKLAMTDHDYVLLADGREVARARPALGAKRATFALDAAALPEADFELDIVCAPGETAPKFFGHRRGFVQTRMPVCTSSREVTTSGTHSWAWLPITVRPKHAPIKPRATPHFSHAAKPSELWMDQVLPVRGVLHGVSVDQHGTFTTADQHAYVWTNTIERTPNLALRDGPRNVGAIYAATALVAGRNGGAYGSDGHRVFHVSRDGHVRTLAGYRHKPVPSYWDGPQELELVGDWSRVPEARRRIQDAWGWAWNTRSTTIDETLPLIDGEHPHGGNPQGGLANSAVGSINLITFDGRDRSKPAVVTELVSGLADPWDIVYDEQDHVYYISEREAHRLSAYDADTGALVRVLLQGADLAYLASDRVMVRRPGVTADQCRAARCVGPEGLARLPGDDWIYFGSKVMDAVCRVHRRTGAWEMVADPVIDGASNFVKIALSDGTFGPRGTVFVTTWGLQAGGFPEAYLPGGARWHYHRGGGEMPGGRPANDSPSALAWDEAGYPSACCIGDGALWFSTSQQGLMRISLALPDDKPANLALYRQGRAEFAPHRITHGSSTYGFFGLPLPWGQSEALDHYLQVNGHQR